MLKNVKSSFILKIILCHVNYKIKIRLVVHNKKIQNILGLNIVDYIRYSGRYIIGDINGEGKEYNGYNNQLLYEGEFSKGKRNGKGRDFNDKGKLCFKGEYLNGIRLKGICLEYDKYGNFVFKEEYLNGKNKFKKESINSNKNGNNKEYYHGKLIFEGEYLNGKRNGKGKEYHENGEIKFEGEYLFDHRVRGKYYISKYMNNILEYEGEYLYDKKWEGKGYDHKGNVIYELIYGTGKVKEYNDKNKLIFEEEYLYDNDRIWKLKGMFYFDLYEMIIKEYLSQIEIKNTKAYIKKYFNNYSGILEFESEYILDEINYRNGDWIFDFDKRNKNGKGKKYYNNGKIKFDGEFFKGKKWKGNGYDLNNNIVYDLEDGKGYVKKYYDNGKLKFEGQYLNGEKNGKGKEYHKNGKLEFVGDYCDGEKKGKGKEFYDNGKLKFEGEYLNGERNGMGKEYNKYGGIEFQGTYLDGERKYFFIYSLE